MTQRLTQNAYHALVEMWGPWRPLSPDLALLATVTVPALPRPPAVGRASCLALLLWLQPRLPGWSLGRLQQARGDPFTPVKYWCFSFNVSPSNEHPGLVSFRMDLLDLLAVQGTLKSLIQPTP